MKDRLNFTKLAAVLILTGILLTGCGDGESAQTTAATEKQPLPVETTHQTEPTAVDVLEILEVRERDALVEVETSYCTVSYPYAFSDLMTLHCQRQDGVERLVFGASLEQREYSLFYLSFGQTEGILLGQLVLPLTGETVLVWAGLYPLEEGVSEADQGTCLAVQECINDVIAALGENSNFTPAE